MSKRSTSLGLWPVQIKPVRAAIGLAVGAVGLWIGSLTLAEAMYKRDPARAIIFDHRNIDALAQQSRVLLEKGALRDASRFARAALTRDATAVGAVQSLGIAAQMAGNLALADRWLSYAKRLSRRELQTNLWAIEYHVLRGDSAKALGDYDLALRTSVPVRDTLFPVLGQAVNDPNIARKLIKILVDRPLWYADFLSFLASDERVAPLVATRFLSAAKSRNLNAPSSGLQVLVSRSFQAQKPEIAWLAYKLKRPSVDQRHLRDPSFADIPENATLFDWTLANEGNIFVQPIREDGYIMLNVEAGAGSAGLAAQQAQVLPPDNYRFVVQVKEAALSDGSLNWTMTCSDGTELAKLPITNHSTRTVAAMTFRIPSGCTSQLLKLNVYAGDLPDGVRARFASANFYSMD